MAGVYRPRAVFQLKRDPKHPIGSRLGGVNCNPTAAATLVDFATCGRRTTTGAAVRELTGDTEGGTTLGPVTRAVRRGFKVDMDRNTGPWSGVIRALEAGRGVSLCGSSIATVGTAFQASETFDGNHQWAVTAIRTREGGGREILVFDPLADGRRAAIARSPMWMPASIVRTFAGQLDLRSQAERDAHAPRRPLGLGRASYAVTEESDCAVAAAAPAAPVPAGHGDAGGPVPVRLRPGARRVKAPAGRELEVGVPVARVRARPNTAADIVGRKEEGDVFRAFQRIRGQRVAGDRLWFGDRLGTRWMHASLFALGEAGEVDADEPGEDPDAVGLGDGDEAPGPDDELLEGLEDGVDEELLDEVPAETDPGD